MNINKMTLKVQEALGSAQSMATRRSHQQVDVEHLFTALLEQEGGLAANRDARADEVMRHFRHARNAVAERKARPSLLNEKLEGGEGKMIGHCNVARGSPSP